MTERRPPGTGSISNARGYWWAAVQLQDRRRIRRRRYTREDAEAALLELMDLYREQLGYTYHRKKPYYHGTRPKSVRDGLSARLRFIVLERDGFRCRYCGATADQVRLHVDHVIPIVKGGTNDLGNLVTACAPCNQGKAAMTLSEGSA